MKKITTTKNSELLQKIFNISIFTMPPKAARTGKGNTTEVVPDIIPLSSTTITSSNKPSSNKNLSTQISTSSGKNTTKPSTKNNDNDDDDYQLKPSERQGVVYLGQ